MQSFVVQLATSEDRGDIHALLGQGEKNGEILPRTPEEMDLAADRQLALVIRDQQRKVVAFTAAFPQFGTETQNEYEIGSTYIAPAIRGFGLQLELVGLRIVLILLGDRDCRCRHIKSVIDAANQRSTHNIEKAGFMAGEPTPSALALCPSCNKFERARCRGESCCSVHYTMSDYRAPRHFLTGLAGVKKYLRRGERVSEFRFDIPQLQNQACLDFLHETFNAPRMRAAWTASPETTR